MTTIVKKTIICVDDEQRILNSLKMLLKKDFNVLTTTDGNEAIQLLKQQEAHVIISDQRMPKMTGVDLLRQSNEISPNTMRILLTGYSDLAAVVGSINDGEIYRFIHKPWSNNYIKKLVTNAASISTDLWANENPSDVNPSAQKNAEQPNFALPSTGILILDQDNNMQIILQKSQIFREQNLFSADSIEQALAFLEHESIGVVIADISCGKENIIEFINILKVEHPLVLTIIQTELMDFSSIVSLINSGQIFKYIPKPVTIMKIESYLTHAIQRHHKYATNPKLLKRHKVDVISCSDQPGDSVTLLEQKLSMAQRIGRRLRGLRKRLRY